MCYAHSSSCLLLMEEGIVLVTIYDIAKKAGLSPTTISKALNDYRDISVATKRKVRAIALEMGYTPNSSARSLATNKSWLIGVLYNEDHDLGIRHMHLSEVIEQFKERVEESGYELIFIGNKIGERRTSYYEHCLYRGVDAVFIANGLEEEEALQELIRSSIPCVASELVSPEITCILSDNVTGGRKAVDYLYSLGHKRVAHIAAPLLSVAGRERLLGYKLSFEAHSGAYSEDYVRIAEIFNSKSGYEAMQSLLSMPVPPTAVFCANDNLACGAITAAKESGLYVPEDISVIGFDDIEIASYMVLSLTTVRQDRARIGQYCADMILKILDGETIKPQNIRIPTKLVIRNSCRRLNDNMGQGSVLRLLES